MRNTRVRTLLTLTVVFGLQPPILLVAAPVGTAFNYQGRLNDGSSPANGYYDLRFTLNDAASGSSQIGNALTNPATPVSNGLFTVTLDFGANAFSGAARWLEIGVRTNGGGRVYHAQSPATAGAFALRALCAQCWHFLHSRHSGDGQCCS